MKNSILFQKTMLGPLELKNRFATPPMAIGYCDSDRLLGEREIAYYEARAKGGFALITSSAFAVTEGLCDYVVPIQCSMAVPGAQERLAKAVERIHKYGAKFVVQLLHPGRQAPSVINGGAQPLAPSAIAEDSPICEEPRELTNEEVKTIVKGFIDSAKKAYEAGADGVELHGAHGYLIYQFYAARANKRTDEYGGSFENRMRFIKEIADGINAIKPEGRSLSMRQNAADLFEGGMTLEEGIQVGNYLKDLGFDYINLSCGTYVNALMASEPAPMSEGCRSDWIKAFKDAVDLPISSVNHVKRPETALKLVEDGVLDVISLGRPSLADPEFVNKAAEGRSNAIFNCISCCACLDSCTVGPAKCSLNPVLGMEYLYNDETLKKDGNGRQVVVIGGGPGGMEAAIVAAKRGFKVTLIDSGDKLGGSLIMASKATGKDKVNWALEGFTTALKDLGVEVKLNTEINKAEEIKALEPYAVILATGSKPILPPIPGLDGDNVYLAHDLLKDGAELPKGQKIALVGSGMTGLECAEVLAEAGNKIVMYDMLDEIAKGANLPNKVAIMGILGKYGVEYKTKHKLEKVADGKVYFEDLSTGKTVADEADIVVLSLGVKPDKEQLEALKASCDKVFLIGDCTGSGKIIEATASAFEVAWNL